MDLRSVLKQALGVCLLVNFLIGVMLYIAIEQEPVTPFLSTSLHNRFEDAPYQPYWNSKAWRDYLRAGDFANPHQGILNDPGYCDKVAAYREERTLTLRENGLPVREEIVVFSDYKPGNLVKDVIETMGTLSLEGHYLDRPTSVSPT